MSLNFPSNPQIGQSYFSGSKYWTWNGYAWKVNNFVPVQQPNIFLIDGNGAADTDTEIFLAPAKEDTTLTNKTISADNNTLSGIAASSFVLSNASGNIDGAAAQKAIPAGVVVGTTDTQTLSGKTLTEPLIDGTIVEEVFTITDGASVDIDPSNGSIQLWTLTASRTPVLPTSWTAGQGITLQIADGTAYAITWTTMGVIWVGGVAPPLAEAGYTVVELWKVGTTIYGALVGDVA
jgi:hypothetical protein